MAVYIVTGTLGSGKTLVCVGRIRDYLFAGRPVATNLDLRLEVLCQDSSSRVVRVPDFPSARDLEFLGVGNPTTDESKNGLIVLDEAGAWLNSRGWQGEDRERVIRWFLHARKLGWDVLLIVQDIAMVDKQVRVAFCEHVVRCKRLDRFNVPLLGSVVSWFGAKMHLPQIHFANVFYGTSPHALVVERWYYRGRDLWDAYQTRQIFTQDGTGLASMLSPKVYRWMRQPPGWGWQRHLKGAVLALYERWRPATDAENAYRCFRLAERFPGLFAGLRAHAPRSADLPV